MRSQSRCTLRLRYVNLIVSIDVAVEVHSDLPNALYNNQTACPKSH
jgi:hypothetical protein